MAESKLTKLVDRLKGTESPPPADQSSEELGGFEAAVEAVRRLAEDKSLPMPYVVFFMTPADERERRYTVSLGSKANSRALFSPKFVLCWDRRILAAIQAVPAAARWLEEMREAGRYRGIAG